MVATPQSDAPERLGKYQILGILGRGSMGVVYLGHDPFVDRRVAVKVCAVDTEDQGDLAATRARRLFFNEAQAAGALDHPNILRVFDADQVDGEPFIVMEYVDGAKSLRDFCHPDRLLPVETVVELVMQCARALDYAHRRGVTHRDIKPANIMLTRAGSAKIVDFGIAQRVNTETTQVLGNFGSPRYMSPEQAKDADVTTQSDLFSLGVVLYELLAGTPPFVAPRLPALLYKVVHEQPRPLGEVRPELPTALLEVVERAMKKDPAHRFPTGEDMAAGLAGVLDDLNRGVEELDEGARLELARGLAFFDGFTDEEVEEIVAAAEWENFEPGARLLGQGDEGERLYIVAGGEVTVVRDGRELAVLGVGECFGEIGFLSGEVRSASVMGRSRGLLLGVDAPARDWASLPCQLRLARTLQSVLIQRLVRTSSTLAKLPC